MVSLPLRPDAGNLHHLFVVYVYSRLFTNDLHYPSSYSVILPAHQLLVLPPSFAVRYRVLVHVICPVLLVYLDCFPLSSSSLFTYDSFSSSS